MLNLLHIYERKGLSDEEHSEEPSFFFCYTWEAGHYADVTTCVLMLC